MSIPILSFIEIKSCIVFFVCFSGGFCMKKRSCLVSLCLALVLSSITLSGCSFIQDRGIQMSDEGYLSNLVKEEDKNASYKEENVKDTKETEEVVEKEETISENKNNGGFGSIDEKETTAIVEETETETESQVDFGITDNSETTSSEAVIVESEADKSSSAKEITGVRQYNKFRADMTGYNYMGRMTKNDLVASLQNSSLFYQVNGDKKSAVMMFYDDSMKDLGLSISFDDSMGGVIQEQFINSFLGDDLGKTEFVNVGNTSALYCEFSVDNTNVCLLMNMSDSIMTGVIISSTDTSTSLKSDAISLYSKIDFNGGACDPDLDYVFNQQVSDLLKGGKN